MGRQEGGGCCGAPLAVRYVSFSGDSAATANEVLTWTDDKLLRGGGGRKKKEKKRMSSVAGICSGCVLLGVLFNGISLSKLCVRYADGICDGAISRLEWIHYMFLSAEIRACGLSKHNSRRHRGQMRNGTDERFLSPSWRRANA